MFYEKLAEAKEEKRLSVKQKAGIAGAVGLGALGTRKALRYVPDDFVSAHKHYGKRAVALAEELQKKYGDDFEFEGGVGYDEANRRFGKLIKEQGNTRRLRKGGLMALGGLTAGYGAKKLYDRYNRRKQQREE
jgi:hypothetical protein